MQYRFVTDSGEPMIVTTKNSYPDIETLSDIFNSVNVGKSKGNINSVEWHSVREAARYEEMGKQR